MSGTIFYPSTVINLRIRFDELLLGQVSPEAQSAAELADKPLTTSVQLSASDAPELLEGADGKLSFIVGRVPRSCSVELPAYRQAGKFEIELDWTDLPIDPRLVRACGVEIHIGVVDPSNFATGMVSSTADGKRLSILNTRDEAGNPNVNTLVSIGIVDGWTVKHGEKGGSVTIEGRDIRCVLIDSSIVPETVEALDLTKPLDEVVRDILALHPFGSRMVVEVNPGEWDGGVIPSPATDDGVTRVRKPANVTKTGKPKKAPAGDKNKTSYWDLITQYCFLCGAIPFYAGSVLRIRPSRSLYDLTNRAGFDPKIPTPFLDGKLRDVDGTTLNQRWLVYGKDLSSLSFERKLGGSKPRIVEVVSLDTSSDQVGAKKLLVAQWPPEAGEPGGQGSVAEAEKTSVAPSGSNSDQQKMRISVPGIRNQVQLENIAKSIFEEIGRSEIGGAFETTKLTSFGGDSTDVDVLRIRPGDAVQLLIDGNNIGRRSGAATLNKQEGLSDAAAIKEYTTKLGDESLARAIVASARGRVTALTNYFRIGNIKFTWDTEKGIGVQGDYQNYVEIRSEIGKAPDPGNTAVKRVPVHVKPKKISAIELRSSSGRIVIPD